MLTLLPITMSLALTMQAPEFQYPAPAPGSVIAVTDVTVGDVAGTTLKMDVYKPAAGAAAPRPALIFFNRAVGAGRSNAFYRRWAEIAASKGVVGILPDLRDGLQEQDFDALLAHLAAKSADYGIDANAIAVYAASGNVAVALPLLQHPKRTMVRAAVIYYGTASVTDYRLDLPMLWVRAGLDRPGVNRGMMDMAARAITQNAPLTLLNHPNGYHGFEARNAGDATREIVDRTIDFVTRTLAPAYQTAMAANLDEARAAGHSLAGNTSGAAALYASLVASRPDEPTLRLAYGEALLADRQFAVACDEFAKLKGQGLGYRDLGLPAARACMQKGDADAAVAWLMSIPHRFLPQSVATEAIFASIKDRADFKAAFAPR